MAPASTSSSSSSSVLLVTGASGPLGTSVVNHLLHTLRVEPSRIVAGTRDPEKLAHFADAGVTVRKVDFDLPETIASASAGITRALLISTSGAVNRLGQHKAAIDAFAAAGVQHILYTSLPEICTQGPAGFVVEHEETEKMLQRSAVPGYTILRNGLYFELNVPSLRDALRTGVWQSATGDGKAAFIARDDLGLADAVALANNDSNGRYVYTLTGSEALSIAKVVDQCNTSFGTTFTPQPNIPEHDRAQQLMRFGVQAAIAHGLAKFETNIKDGYGAQVTDDFKKLTGSEPRTLETWFKAEKNTLLTL
uniref:NmrA-like domain-containing protein n=1 Tax=Globisporangium ultimum (strain ATCC 200006 / CBS 805.95 / DAOM BR144) TaxID=431595 RepID=K3WJE3_GLOUD